MGINGQGAETFRFNIVNNGYTNVLVVESCARIYLHLLLDNGVRLQPKVNTRTRQCMAVDENLGAVFVHGFLEIEQQLLGNTIGELALV